MTQSPEAVGSNTKVKIAVESYPCRQVTSLAIPSVDKVCDR